MEHCTGRTAGRIPGLWRLVTVLGFAALVASLAPRPSLLHPAVRHSDLGTRVALAAPPRDHLPASAIARLGHGTLQAMEVSGDGQTLVVGSGTGVQVYDAATLALRWQHSTTDPARAVAVSTDGSRVAAYAGEHVTLWDGRTGDRVQVLGQAFVRLQRLAFDPAGARLAAVSCNTVTLWDASTGRPLGAIEQPQQVTDAVWSPDGRRLALGSSAITIWSARGSRLLQTLDVHQRRGVAHMAWSQDGSRIGAALLDGSTVIWSLRDDRAVWSTEAHTIWASSAAFSSLGTSFVTGDQTGEIAFWDAASGALADRVQAHESRVVGLGFGIDGRLVSASTDGTAVTWNTVTRTAAAELDGYASAATAVAWSPDGELIAVGGMDGRVDLWRAHTRRHAARIPAHEQLVTALAWSPDSTRLATLSTENDILLWDVSSGQLAQRFEGQPHADLASRTRSLGRGITIEVGTVEQGPIVGHTDAPLVVAFSPDGALLASGGKDGRVIVWDAISGEAVSVMEGHPLHVNQVAFTTGGTQLVSASADGTQIRWELQTGQPLSTARHAGIDQMVLAPDGLSVALSSGGGHPIVRAATGSHPGRELAADVGQTIAIQFSPDARLLATGSRADLRSVLLWDVVTGQPLKSLQGHSFDVSAVSFSPDGATLATASWDGSVLLWSTGD